MKKGIVIILLTAMCVTLSSCVQSQGASVSDDAYIEGIEQGYEDVFTNLWYASTGVIILEPGELWETDHFSVLITSGQDKCGENIHIELATLDLTITECFDEQQMLFNVFSYDGSQFDGLLTGDLFYMNALLEDVGKYTAEATVGFYDTTECIAILVVVDGCIYKAIYYV